MAIERGHARESLKKSETQEKNVLPTAGDIAAEKAAAEAEKAAA